MAKDARIEAELPVGVSVIEWSGHVEVRLVCGSAANLQSEESFLCADRGRRSRC